MDNWAWQQLQQWLDLRIELPVGPLFCVLTGPTHGRGWSPAAVREQLRHTAALAGVRRRFAPHQLRHAHAVEMAREGVPRTSSNANSDTPTSASLRSTYRASTAPGSSTPSTPAALPWCPVNSTLLP